MIKRDTPDSEGSEVEDYETVSEEEEEEQPKRLNVKTKRGFDYYGMI